MYLLDVLVYLDISFACINSFKNLFIFFMGKRCSFNVYFIGWKKMGCKLFGLQQLALFQNMLWFLCCLSQLCVLQMTVLMKLIKMTSDV